MTSVKPQSSFEKPACWGVYLLFLIVSAYAIAHHELWGDEVHSWNIAKGSAGYFDLIYNTRYEGHPPVWYTILWTISKFTHNLAYVQMVHWVIASLSMAVVLFFSPIPFITRILIPFGYYFLYEYSALSRNYAIGILLAFCICVIICRNFRYKIPIYYLLLFLMTNTHLLAILLAASLHCYFLFSNFEQKKSRRIVGLHILIGLIVSLPALYFIFPPSDSQLNTQYWISRWNSEQIKAFGQAPLRSFIPIPAWWKYNIWNTQFLLDSENKSKVLNLVVASILLSTAVYVLYRNKKSLVVFLINLFLSFIIAVAVFPLTSGRYAGFVYIGFIVAYWLYCYEVTPTRTNKWLVNGMLAIQIVAAVFVVSRDNRLPFSNANKVTELLKTPAPNERIVTDYWAMNAVSAFGDRPVYCIDLQKEVSFVLWGPDLAKILKRPYRYSDGVKNLFQKEGIDTTYLISLGSPETLKRVDQQLFNTYRVNLIDKREGAIEKGGNVYLYRVSSY